MVKTTKNQDKAIKFDGKNILVSASAGSGKTFVMIERIIRLIIEEGVEVSSILAVTYTNLAASEMKQKLVKAVLKRIGEGKDVEKMRKTLAEIPTADISTFHSFCLSLLRAYFYLADVEPDFSVADTSKDKEISQLAINTVFNDLYKNSDQDFLKLVRLFRKNRGDSSLKEEILILYDKSVSESDPEKFLQDCALAVNEENYCKYEEFLLDVYKKKLTKLTSNYQKIKDRLLAYSDEKEGLELLDSLEDAMIKVKTVQDCKDFKDFIFKSSLKTKSSPRITSEDENLIQLKQDIADFKAKLSEFYRETKKILPENREEDLNRFLQTKEIISSLVKTTALFSACYAELKQREGVVNFADLEHKTLKLLRENPVVLEAIRSKYKYVFADEYQDVNGVQEEILNLVASDNLFMVGDVKQSIYAFRGCNPEIFASKFNHYEDTKEGEPITLESNFRSSDEVLNAVNNVFEKIMTKANGGVDYASNKMVGGGSYKEGDGEALLHVIEVEKADKQLIGGLYNLYQDATTTEEDDNFYEGSLVAKIIEDELKKEFFDVSIGKYRKVQPSDIAVLTRSSSGFTDDVVKWLIREGVPVVSESKVDILSYPEIKLLLSVLKLINFYADDPPLATVLKSAIGKLNEEDLAKIRQESIIGENKKDFSFLQCVEKYKICGSDKVLRQKLLDFEEYFNKLRVLSEFLGAGEILSKVLRETGLDLSIASQNLGKLRIARVERLIAETQPSGKKLTVGEFLDRIENSGESISVSEVAGSDAVKVVSMHSSKGLEYPIVILAGLYKKFNAKDDAKQILFSRKHGIATYYYDEQTKWRYNTLARTFFKQTSAIERANEEARVFYVAMTRAKARLHLITTKQVQQERVENSHLFTNSFTDFLTLADMPVINYKSSELIKDKNLECKTVILGSPKESIKNIIVNNLTFKYPHQVEVTLPVKSSATEVNGRHNEKKKFVQQGKSFHKPHLIADEEVDKREVGTSYHHFLQLCDLTDKNANKQLIDLLSSGKMTQEEVSLLDEGLLSKILSNPLWEKLEGYKLYKEQPFLSSFTAKELYGEESLANVLIQGIIDLLAVKGDEVILVDYKTSDHDASQLVKDYEMQLLLYKKAIEKVLKKKVIATYILSLKTGELIEL